MEPAASRRAWERTERFFDAWLHPMAIANLHDARWLRVNHSFCSLLGWSPETALTMSLFDMVDSPDLAGVKEVVSRLSQGDHVEDWPVRIRRQDGSWTTVLWQAAGSPEDEVLSFVGRVREHSCFDAQQLRLAKDAAGLGIHDVDVATGVIRCP
jgi:PAS domain S-box-containing protein